MNSDFTDSLTIQHAGGTDTHWYVSVPGVVNDSFWATAALAGAWHHFAVTYDGSTVYFYVDGVQQGSGVAHSGSCGWNTSHSIHFGGCANGGVDCTTPIADPMLWEFAQPVAVISALADPANVDLRVGGVPLVRKRPRAPSDAGR